MIPIPGWIRPPSWTQCHSLLWREAGGEGGREDNGGVNDDNHEQHLEDIQKITDNILTKQKLPQVCYQQLTAIANNVSDWSRVKLDYKLSSFHDFDADYES